MDREILFRGKVSGKRLNKGEWIEGNLVHQLDYYGKPCDKYFILNKYDTNDYEIGEPIQVDPATVGQFTVLCDKDGKKIFEGDITELTLENGEIRRFVVDIRTVTRTLVSHPDFNDETAKVQITGVVFLWQGYELFPCIDSNGASDVSKMEVIGNIHDTPNVAKEESE